MPAQPYDLMQKAVDAVGGSPHPTNKIAATLSARDFTVVRTNYWPAEILQHLGQNTRIGNSSGTIHAETACLLSATGPTEGASLFVTDVPCPNCVKYMAESGIKALYIDHKGFDKDFALRRGGHFETMAMRMCEHAGISVYKIFRKQTKIETILGIPDSYVPASENPASFQPLQAPLTPALFGDYIGERQRFYGEKPFACAAARDRHGKTSLISACVHPAIGYTSDTMEEPEGKYSYLMQPVNRLIMNAARRGLKIDPAYLYSSRVPTARELVNLVGASLTELRIGNPVNSRDENGLHALALLSQAQIINILS